MESSLLMCNHGNRVPIYTNVMHPQCQHNTVNSQLIFCLRFLLLIKFQIFFQTVNSLFTMETVAMDKNQHLENLFKYTN